MKREKKMDKKGILKMVALGFLMLFVLNMIGCTGDVGKGECYWDYEVRIVNHIGEFNSYSQTYTYEPEEGYKFVIATIRIKNNSTEKVSTNPYLWDLTTNENITYEIDMATYDDSIYQQTVDVEKGGDITVEHVYEVPVSATKYTLKYSGVFGFHPKMVLDESLLS